MLPEGKEGSSSDCLGVLVRHQLRSSALLLKLLADGVPEGSCKHICNINEAANIFATSMKVILT